MLRESPNREYILPYFGGVKERVQAVLAVATVTERPEVNSFSDEQKKRLQLVEAPQVVNWPHITDEELMHVRIFLYDTQTTTAPIGSAELLEKLNADDRFFQHLDIMEHYVDVICDFPEFIRFLKRVNLSKNFLKALVLLHDYGRCVFNGPLPLKYIDTVSDAILSEVLPTFPKEYLHSIKWITEELPAPDLEHGQPLPISEISLEYVIGLMLKAIDTLGKLDTNGQLIQLAEFFVEGGMYETWLERQQLNHRLPFNLTASKIVSKETYASNDKRLTEKGAEIIATLTGQQFSDISQAVEERLVK